MSFIKLFVAVAFGVAAGLWLYNRFFVPKVHRKEIIKDDANETPDC